MAATTWRMNGIDTYGGGDLELSELRLWGVSAALDAGATLTCSHAPIAGALENLIDGNPATTCRWRAADVRSPGFFVQWVTPAAVDAWCVRLSAPVKERSIARYDLACISNGLWLAARNGDLVYVAGLSAPRINRPVYGSQIGWRQAAGPVADSGGYIGVAMSADGQYIAAAGYGSANSKLSISKDSGVTWTQPAGPLAGNSGFGGVAMSADGQTIAVTGYGSGAGKLSLSKDGGTSWTQPAGPAVGSGGLIGVGMSADGQTIAVAGYGSGAAKLSLSKDGGATWVQPNGPEPNTTGFSGVAVSADGQTIAVVAPSSASSKLSLSRDGGATWTQPAGAIPGSGGFWAVAVSGNGQTIVTTGQGAAAAKVCLSKDGGATWVQLSPVAADSNGYSAVAVSSDGVSIIIGTQGSGSSSVALSRDGGSTWTRQAGAAPGVIGFLGAAISADASMTTAAASGSVNATISLLLLPDPSYVAQPLTMLRDDPLSVRSDVLPPVQGLQGTNRVRVRRLIDAECGGQGRIYGTVARKNTPTNVPMSRRVRLHRSVDGYLARETWSKADGTYEFRDISTRYEWDVIAWDHELQEYSAIANNQRAEAT